MLARCALQLWPAGPLALLLAPCNPACSSLALWQAWGQQQNVTFIH
jgi:hypothetical protein